MDEWKKVLIGIAVYLGAIILAGIVGGIFGGLGGLSMGMAIVGTFGLIPFILFLIVATD